MVGAPLFMRLFSHKMSLVLGQIADTAESFSRIS